MTPTDKELRALAEAMIERVKRRAEMTEAEEIAFDFGLDDLSEDWQDAASPATVIGLLDRIERQHNDIGILIAMIEWLEEVTGEGPEEEDGVIFAQIRQSHNEAIAIRRAEILQAQGEWDAR